MTQIFLDEEYTLPKNQSTPIAIGILRMFLESTRFWDCLKVMLQPAIQCFYAKSMWAKAKSVLLIMEQSKIQAIEIILKK